MIKKGNIKTLARKKRHRRIRNGVVGVPERPRLCIFRSAKHIYAQIIDDDQRKTLVAVSSTSRAFRQELKTGGNITAAKLVGSLIAKLAKAKGIEKVVFDRGGYLYHGRVKALAVSARENGLVF
jgi:large subunit ribosomal protein L18